MKINIILPALLLSALTGLAADCVKFRVKDPQKVRGTLCLTFDDRNFAAWRKAMPLFDKYGARATFFINGPIDGAAFGMMKELRRHGHSIGLHGLKHERAPKLLKELGPEGYLKAEVLPQLDAAKAEGFVIRNFGYPYSTCDAATEEALARHFSRRRTGCVFGRDPKKRPLAACDELFVPEAEFCRRGLLSGTGVGSLFDGMEEDVVKAVKRLSARGEGLVLYTHSIRDDGSCAANDVSLGTLEALLRAAHEKGVRVIGFDELDALQGVTSAVQHD